MKIENSILSDTLRILYMKDIKRYYVLNRDQNKLEQLKIEKDEQKKN